MRFVKLENLVKSNITKGTTPTTIGYSFENSGVNFFKVENINNNTLIEKDIFISYECNEKMKRSQLEENDILISIAGTIGETAIVKKENLPANINQAIAIIRLKENENVNYINYQLKKIKNDILKNSNKGVISNLNLETIKNIDIFYPPKDIQNKIAKKLLNQEELINKIKSLLEKVEIRNQYYADKLLSGELSIDEEGKITSNNLIKNNLKKCKLKDFKYNTIKGVEGKKGYLEIGDIDIKNKKYNLDKKDKLSVKGCRFCEKNILIISTVRPQRLGYTITKEDLLISNAFVALDINKNKIIEYIIKTKEFMNHLIQNSEGGIYPTIKESRLLDFEFLYDYSKEDLIYRFLKNLDLEKDKVERLLELEEKRFEWLSDKLLSGAYIKEE